MDEQTKQLLSAHMAELGRKGAAAREAKYSREQRREHGKKAWETRRKKQTNTE